MTATDMIHTYLLTVIVSGITSLSVIQVWTVTLVQSQNTCANDQVSKDARSLLLRSCEPLFVLLATDGAIFWAGIASIDVGDLNGVEAMGDEQFQHTR